MNLTVLRAIFQRDFVSYFSSPTGYVFICVFVVLSSLATFWPPEFFQSNLANLDQLSRWLPFIMLVFIPAITMSTWAEERRQGTDELLLTLPATDFDVVLGKYKAGVAIFTVSLLFSAMSIWVVFKWGLGDPDFGLFVSTYIGYWFIGIAMVAVGMVASFVTDNLTVGFILGTVFNLPLALFGVADWFLKNPSVSSFVRRWSAAEQFQDFERGVISLGGVTYFVMIAVVMLYLSMVLIGRRHWQARDDGESLGGHYLIRTIALLLIAIGVTQFVRDRNSLRLDISTEQLSSLSGDTLDFLKQLRGKEDAKPIEIEAFVSPQVPAEYAPVKLSLLSTLEELKARSGGKIRVTKNEIENYGPEAVRAERTYGITPEEIVVTNGKERSQEEFFMGVAFTSGVRKVVVPFIGKRTPVEYELVRSIWTVSEPKRKRIGIVGTGFPLMRDFAAGQSDDWPLVTELRKQYDVDDRPIDPTRPIPNNYDAILAVQPSMLGPQEMDHFVDAVRRGTPTVILEDPHPHLFYAQTVPGTAEPKRSGGGGMMGMFGGGQNEPKGDINQLWRTLGVDFSPIEVVWQDYKPEQSVRAESDLQWVFIDEGNGAEEPFNEENAITSGLNQVLLLYPGAVSKDSESTLNFEQLAVTNSERSGTVDAMALQRGSQNERVFSRRRTNQSYILAAYISGEYQGDDMAIEGFDMKALTGLGGQLETEEEEEEEEIAETDQAEEADAGEEPTAEEKPAKEAKPQIKAVVVTDVDWIIPAFFYFRQQGDEDLLPATQNVTFILNCVDAVAGDDRFLDIRKRARRYRTLTKIDSATQEYRDNAVKDQEEFVAEIETEISKAQQSLNEKVEEIESREGLSTIQKEQQIALVREREEKRVNADIQALEADRSRRVKQIRYEMEEKVRGVQDRYKLYAILVPPIPPLMVALYVFFRRRESEREGVSQDRLK